MEPQHNLMNAHSDDIDEDELYDREMRDVKLCGRIVTAFSVHINTASLRNHIKKQDAVIEVTTSTSTLS
jgi:hypothetical protein